MKKLLALALLTVAASVQAEPQYCTPEAVKEAYQQYQNYLDANRSNRTASAMAAGSVAGFSNGQSVINNQNAWAAADKNAYDMTIGKQKALCEAEMLYNKQK